MPSNQPVPDEVFEVTDLYVQRLDESRRFLLAGRARDGRTYALSFPMSASARFAACAVALYKALQEAPPGKAKPRRDVH